MNSHNLLPSCKLEILHSSIVALALYRLHMLALLHLHCLHVVFLPSSQSDRSNWVSFKRKVRCQLRSRPNDWWSRTISVMQSQTVYAYTDTSSDFGKYSGLEVCWAKQLLGLVRNNFLDLRILKVLAWLSSLHRNPPAFNFRSNYWRCDLEI